MTEYINDRRAHPLVSAARLQQLLAPVLAALAIDENEIEIELVGDELITALNDKFFNRLRPTNVLSFPLDREAGHLGSVVVSVDTVLQETQGLGYEAELAVLYYLIHGLLHLLGYEHVGVTDAIASRMEEEQDRLFDLVLDHSGA